MTTITKLESLIGKAVLGIEIDAESESITFHFEHGFIEVSGEFMEAYIELDDIN